MVPLAPPRYLAANSTTGNWWHQWQNNRKNIAVILDRTEPRHDKTNKMSVRPAKTQTSLGIRPVWSESSMCVHCVAKYSSFLHADSEDWSDWSDAQADPSLRWAHTHFVGFVMSRLRLQIPGSTIVDVCCCHMYSCRCQQPARSWCNKISTLVRDLLRTARIIMFLSTHWGSNIFSDRTYFICFMPTNVELRCRQRWEMGVSEHASF